MVSRQSCRTMHGVTLDGFIPDGKRQQRRGRASSAWGAPHDGAYSPGSKRARHEIDRVSPRVAVLGAGGTSAALLTSRQASGTSTHDIPPPQLVPWRDAWAKSPLAASNGPPKGWALGTRARNKGRPRVCDPNRSIGGLMGSIGSGGRFGLAGLPGGGCRVPPASVSPDCSSTAHGAG